MNKRNENLVLLRSLVREALQVVLAEKKPGGGLTDFGAKKRLEPNEWHGDVSRAIAATGGDVESAADRLGIAGRTLYAALEDSPTLQSVKDATEKKEEEKSDIKKKKEKD